MLERLHFVLRGCVDEGTQDQQFIIFIIIIIVFIFWLTAGADCMAKADLQHRIEKKTDLGLKVVLLEVRVGCRQTF